MTNTDAIREAFEKINPPHPDYVYHKGSKIYMPPYGVRLQDMQPWAASTLNHYNSKWHGYQQGWQASRHQPITIPESIFLEEWEQHVIKEQDLLHRLTAQGYVIKENE